MVKASYLLLLAAMLALSACAPFQVHTKLPVRIVKSASFNQRMPNYVIIHHTGGESLDSALHALTTPDKQVSAHYLIARDGEIIQLVAENERAWHAGQSWWGGQTDINSASIGIELDNDSRAPYEEAQIEALLRLLADLQARYGIPAANFIGHADVAPSRKVDPSALFPWARLAAHGFGLWCDAAPIAPPGFDLTLALAALGYDPTLPDAARRAFRLHYLRGDMTVSDDAEKAIAYCLLQKKAQLGTTPKK